MRTGLFLLVAGSVVCGGDQGGSVQEVRPELPEMPQNTPGLDQILIRRKPVWADQPVFVPEIEQDTPVRKPVVRKAANPEKEPAERDWLVEGMRRAQEIRTKRDAETKAGFEAMRLELYPQLFTLPGQPPDSGEAAAQAHEATETSPSTDNPVRIPGAMADPSTPSRSAVIVRSYAPTLPGLTATGLARSNAPSGLLQADPPAFSWVTGPDEEFSKAETAPPVFGDFSGFNRSTGHRDSNSMVSFGGKVGEVSGGVLPFRKLDPGVPAPLAALAETPGAEPLNNLPPVMDRPVMPPPRQRYDFPRLGPRREISDPAAPSPF